MSHPVSGGLAARMPVAPWLRCGVAALVVAVSALPAAAQRPDTVAVGALGPVTVTAERAAVEQTRATAAVTVIEREALEARPLLHLADALALAPGFAFLGGDAAGSPADVTVRGFYGGGEAEYVLLLLDGRPVNVAESGLAEWDLVPLVAARRVEVVRGGASPAWGDAAIGGVVNVVTRGGAPGARASASGGTLGTYALEGAADGRVAGRPFNAFGMAKRYGGFRDHAERRLAALGGSVDLLDGPRGTLALSTLHHWGDTEEPGPVALAAGATAIDSRTASAPFYRFDGADERWHRAALDGRLALGTGAQLDGWLVGAWRASETTETLPLAPTFADTQRRALSAARAEANVQVTADGPLGLGDRLLVGATAQVHGLESAYSGVVAGGEEAYLAADGTPGEPLAQGGGSRTAGALYGQLEVQPVSALRLVAAARLDVLADRFEPQAPQAGPEVASDHAAFSPRVGVNVRWLTTGRQVGTVYAQVGRHFKAPTLDQLFDQRLLALGPDMVIAFSNPDLDPQRGVSAEAGLYHLARLAPGLSARAQLAVYRMDMEDEIDFDLERFAYVNVGESRHEGVEASLEAEAERGALTLGLSATYTCTAATLRRGDDAGRFLKAIPRDVYAVGVRATHVGGLSGSLTLRGADRVWLDDANTVPLDGWTVVDARAAYALPFALPATVFAEAYNLLDAAYSTTGFPDASGTGLVYLFPAAERHVRLGLSASL